MAIQGVVPQENESAAKPNALDDGHIDLWITDQVLSIRMADGLMAWKAQNEHIIAINKMIQDLARAARAVCYQAANDESSNSDFLMQPIEGISDVIIMLSQLSEGLSSKLSSEATP